MKKNIYNYCVGCGLCKSEGKASLKADSKGFLHPESGDSDWLKKICPITVTDNDSKIWGKYVSICYGWSTNEAIRKKASSGGVLTELAIFLLETKQVDGIIHTCMSTDNPTKTIPCISYSREEIINRCGSRYAISHPLIELSSIDKSKRYCFIGKPCDVIALRRFQSIQTEWNEIIPFVFSFFCAGLPSEDAQKELLKTMNCPEDDCVNLTYRGNGWPGFATAQTSSNKLLQIDYDTAWGKILGRDVMPACRFCNDGIGIQADISCGDGWYIKPDGTPDFSEGIGRNIIFIRNKKGEQVFSSAISQGRLEKEDTTEESSFLRNIQKFQFIRRCTMYEKVLALKLMLKPHPYYNLKMCRKLSTNVSSDKRREVFVGTIKRIVKGKI